MNLKEYPLRRRMESPSTPCLKLHNSPELLTVHGLLYNKQPCQILLMCSLQLRVKFHSTNGIRNHHPCPKLNFFKIPPMCNKWTVPVVVLCQVVQCKNTSAKKTLALSPKSKSKFLKTPPVQQWTLPAKRACSLAGH